MKKLIIGWMLLFSPLSAVVYLEPTSQFKPLFEISAVFIEYEGRILLLHRKEDKSQGNKWGIPGGKVDALESSLQAALREVKEETGYDLSSQFIENLGTVYIEYDENLHFVYYMFRTQLREDPAAVKINFNEHKGFTWVTPVDGLTMHLIKDEDACFKLIYPGIEDFILERE